MNRRLCSWLACAAVATGCTRNRRADPESEIAPPAVSPAETPRTTTPFPPSPSPRLSPGPETRPGLATRPATAPAATTAPSPTTLPADNPEEVRSVRGQFTETFEQLELFRREVAELHLDAGERREVKGLFDQAASAWAQAAADLDAGRLPAPERRATLARLARDTESKVKTILGPERSIQLAAYRQTARGGGQRFVARLRIALESLHGGGAALTPGQSPRVESVLEEVAESVQKLPAREAVTFEAEQAVRQRIGALIEETRANLAAVLTPAQMAHVSRQVPSLAKPRDAQAPTTKPQ